MRDSQGYDAPIESFKDGKKSYYRYSDLSFSINNQPLNEREAQHLKESLMTLSRFKGLPQFEWVAEMKARLEVTFRLKSQDKVIEFEENQYLAGKEHIGALYDAIINKKVLNIQYHPFKREDSILMVLHPYFLKQYNNRWFLFGKSGDLKTVTTIALDRIESIQPVHDVYLPNTEINFEEYFEDVIGVTVPSDGIVEKVILKIDADSWPYIKTKPMHGSQKIKEITSKYTIIELWLIPNFELEALIFSHAEKIEVLCPETLRKRIRARVSLLNENYYPPVQNDCID
jgi:predicted DNA-binding transcriptional regulator YafY